MRAVLIAAKELSLAKSRLATALAVEERSRLAEAMFRDVLSAAMQARAPELVAVVTSDRKLLKIADGVGALPIDEQSPRGLNVAVTLATRELVARGTSEVATVLSDIPLTTASDIDTAFAALPRAPAVVLVPSRDLTGTNIIVRTPPGVVATRFGRQSLTRHREDCRRAGIACEVMRMVRPALDLDVPGDLLEFARMPSPTHTFNALGRLGILQGKASIR